MIRSLFYQAYKPSIGGDFQLGRMSWIKPNFLWMMYRSGWGTKPGQEVVLAVRLKREGFDSILAGAVNSSYVQDVYADHGSWKEELATSAVRLQWDPDHDPEGRKVERRAIQLGWRGEVLERYSRDWVVGIEDVSDFVASQRPHAYAGDYEALVTPREEVYPVTEEAVARRIQVSPREA
jgi:hypothetical protein